LLGYLDALCTALIARDAPEIRRLLRHPLARALPRKVREEALAIRRAGASSLMAPVHTLHFFHQTAHVLGARGDPATRPRVTGPQLELGLIEDDVSDGQDEEADEEKVASES